MPNPTAPAAPSPYVPTDDEKRAWNAHAKSIISAIGQFLTWLEEDTKEEFAERLKGELALFEESIRNPHSISREGPM